MISFITFATFFAIVQMGFAQETCATLNCAGYACCPDEDTGPVCIYQPSLYTCASGKRLCGTGEGVCGTACYDASMYTCENGVITQIQTGSSAPPTGAPGSPLCGTVSCNGNQCCNDSVLGPVCIYQPALYTCASGTRLCGTGQGVCGTTCYDASMYGCRNGNLFQLSATQAPTQSATVTSAPTSSPTSTATPTPTSTPTCATLNCAGYACCPDEVTGPVCIYQPSLYTCASGKRLCGTGEGVCGTACYDASMYTCQSGVITQIPQ